MNLKYKVTAFISILLLSVSIISSVVNYRIDVNSTQTQLKNISLPLSLDNIYTEIQQRMIEPLIISSLMASDTFVKEWISDGEKDVKKIQLYLQEIKKSYDIFTAFLVSNKTKNYYNSKGLADTLNINNANDSWYFEFQKYNSNYEVNLDIDEHFSKSLVMFINYKIKDINGNNLATTGVGINLVNIEGMLNEFKEKYKYDVYFVNEAGEIILFTKKLNKRGNINFIDGLKDIKPNIFKKNTGKFEYSYKNSEYLLSTKYIKQLKLYLMVEINKDNYMNSLKQNFYINLAFSLFIALIVIILIIYVINIYQKQLETLSHEDSLTGLANRRKFNEEMEKILNLFYRKNIEKVSLILFDIDDFKKVNDTFGHLTGDAVLIRLADILKKYFRKTDLIVRWGGEEIAIILIDSNFNKTIKLIEKLQLQIKEDEKLIQLIQKPLTLSIGFGELQSKDSLDGLILKVDNALYEAKDSGKDRLVIAK
jgi:diguanylate cyclase (GGDEF)-like protein